MIVHAEGFVKKGGLDLKLFKQLYWFVCDRADELESMDALNKKKRERLGIFPEEGGEGSSHCIVSTVKPN